MFQLSALQVVAVSCCKALQYFCRRVAETHAVPKREIMVQMRIEVGPSFKRPGASQPVHAGKFANAYCSKTVSVGLSLIASWGLQ